MLELEVSVKAHNDLSSVTRICIYVGCHLGINKTLAKIISHFYWKEMNGEIREYIQKCDKCQRTNPKLHKTNPKLHPISVEPAVWHQVSNVC